MLSNKPKSLADIISVGQSQFGKLADTARLHADLSDYLRNNLDQSVAQGFVHCNINDEGTLVISAAGPEWAARLRFESKSIIELCSDRGLQVSTVKFRVSN